MKVDKLTRMGRRRFLEAVAALGVTGEGLAHISRPALADSNIDLDNEIPVIVGWKHTNHQDVVENGAEPLREPEYTGVPQDQWIKVESARDAAKQLRNQLNEIGVSVGVTTTSGHRSRKAVVVKYTTEDYYWKDDFSPELSYEELKNRLPATVTGVAGRGTERSSTVENIPVITKRSHNKFDHPSSDNISPNLNYYDCNYRPVPGGCAWETENGGGSTMGTPVYDNDVGRDRLLTAAHSFLDDELGGEECRQNAGSIDTIGHRVASKTNFTNPPLFDAAVIDPSGVGMRWKLASSTCDDFRSTPIVGSMSNSWLHHLQQTNDLLWKQGATTGIESGEVISVYPTYFTIDIDSEKGDSGSPYYRRNSDGNYFIGGIHRGARPREATKMIEIEDRYNGKV